MTTVRLSGRRYARSRHGRSHTPRASLGRCALDSPADADGLSPRDTPPRLSLATGRPTFGRWAIITPLNTGSAAGRSGNHQTPPREGAQARISPTRLRFQAAHALGLCVLASSPNRFVLDPAHTDLAQGARAFATEDLDDARQQWTLTFARNRTDLGPAHAARLVAEEAAKYEPYVEPRYLDNHDDPAPVSRRRPEPIPTFSRRPGAGPGIGF